MSNDSKTYSVIWEAAAEFKRRTGKTPYVVAGKIDREYIDLNREYVDRKPFKATEALSDPDAVPYYLAYHQTIRAYIGEVKRRWKRGALIDIHGQSHKTKVVYRGTKNGGTLDSIGLAGLYTKNGLYGSLMQQGYPVIPKTAGESEPKYDGGFTVVEYGARGTYKFNAMQVELGKDFRKDKTWRKTGKSLGKAIAETYKRFLPR